jgi:hypothetical protein
MAGRSDDFQDPFANFDDGFGKDVLDDDLDSEFGSLDENQFLTETELPVGGDGFDQYGEPIIAGHESEVTRQDEQYEQYEQSAPEPRAQSSAPVKAEAKPFLKTPAGMFAAGAGTLMVCVVSVVGYNSLTSSPQPLPALPEANNDVVAPRAGDPNFNAKTQPTAASMAVMVDPKPVVKPVETAAVVDPAPVLNQAPVRPVVEQSVHVQNAQGSSDELNRVKAALARQQEETEQLKGVVASLSQGIAKISAFAEKDHDEQVVLREQLESLNKQLAENPAPAATTKPAAQALATKPAPAAVAANEGAKAEAQKSASSQNPLAEGRYRLAGLKVVEATESGKMSVVSKTSNGRVYTLFKGEKLGTPRGSMAVTEIKDDGFLIFVGNKYYIDRVAEEKPVAAPVEASPAPARAQASAAAPSKPSRTSRSKERSPAAVSSNPSRSTSYTLNAVYENGNAFGLVNGDGDFKTYKVGDDVPGLGRISGLDASGNLKAGDSVIKSLY